MGWYISPYTFSITLIQFYIKHGSFARNIIELSPYSHNLDSGQPISADSISKVYGAVLSNIVVQV